MSNTVIFPEEHEYANPPPERDIKRMFDVFVSSAHVGYVLRSFLPPSPTDKPKNNIILLANLRLRKPSPEIYDLAVKLLNKYASTHELQTPILPNEILFLDDIGENLKAAKKAGFRTIKVNLGRTFEAVDELEEATGMTLAGNHPRVPVKPVVRKREGEAKL